MLFTSLNGDKKNGIFMKDFDKGQAMFDPDQNDTISEKD